jgi:hypothetical protein
VRFFVHLLHTRPRVQRAPGIPCALRLEGKEFSSKPRAYQAARSRSYGLTSLRGALLSAEARLRAKADATKQSILSLCGAMDCFASLAMTEKADRHARA